MNTVKCPRCGAETYRSCGGKEICTKCGQKIGLFGRLFSRRQDLSRSREGTRCGSCGEFFPAGNFPTKIWTTVCPKCGDQTTREILAPSAIKRTVASRPDDLDELLKLAPDPRRTYLLQVLFLLPPKKALSLAKAILGRQSDLDPVNIRFGDGTPTMTLDHRDYTEADMRWAENTFELAQQAEAKARSGQYADAIPLLKKALRMSPGQDMLLLTLGVCYAELKQFSTARKIIERAHELYPANRRINDNLEAVRRSAKQ